VLLLLAPGLLAAPEEASSTLNRITDETLQYLKLSIRHLLKQHRRQHLNRPLPFSLFLCTPLLFLYSSGQYRLKWERNRWESLTANKAALGTMTGIKAICACSAQDIAARRKTLGSRGRPNVFLTLLAISILLHVHLKNVNSHSHRTLRSVQVPGSLDHFGMREIDCRLEKTFNNLETHYYK
jgi:hypothetical protein